MCRNIRILFNFDPPTTEDEVRAAALQFVRKISGFTKPSKANEAPFLAAIEEIAATSSRLIAALETTAPPKNRDEEAARAKARSAKRFGGGFAAGLIIGLGSLAAPHADAQLRDVTVQAIPGVIAPGAKWSVAWQGTDNADGIVGTAD